MTQPLSLPADFEHLAFSNAPGPYFEADLAHVRVPARPKVKLIAFFLPQFHAIPENDAWWGAGFTEWTNVTRALPRFAGHVQPRLPADLGFYDLRNVETLRVQAKLARRYGLHGFCFHHYWFNGRRLLERPLELLLEHQDIDLPFCVHWANENWTRRWDGREEDVLIAQAHSPEDDVAFARSLIPIVSDPRYIRIDGRALIMLYRPGLLPNSVATMRRWRTEFARAGEPNPFIVMSQAFGDNDPRLHATDAAAEFPPHKVAYQAAINDRLRIIDPGFKGHVIDYTDVARHAAALPSPPFKMFRTVSPGWDNEARKPGRGLSLANATPLAYGTWLTTACRAAITEATGEDDRIVFINAWNEWAEGAYLEPDRHFGHAYLAETARVLQSLEAGQPGSVPGWKAGAHVADARLRLALVSHDAHFHGAQKVALALAESLVVDHNVSLRVLIGGAGELTQAFRDLAPTETVPGDFNDQAAWSDAARRLVASGHTAVICNTLVSARAIGPLKAAGLRIVQLVHEMPSLIRQYGLEAASRDAAQLADAVVFPSAFVQDRFVSIAGEIAGQVVIRHQGLHIRPVPQAERGRRRAAIRAAHGIASDQRVVIGVGFGDVRKGLDLWPGLIRRVVAQCADVVFVWVGRVEPSLRHWLEHDLRAAGLDRHLIMPGLTDDLASYYAAADAFVLTSREDPFPSVAVEAMANALPTVVFADSGGIADVVRDAGGVAVRYLDIDAMGDALGHLLTDRASAVAIGEGLAARVAAGFDYADYAAALLALAAPPLPSVSVIVPNYNYGRYLAQRLQSIWSQTVPLAEVIILDDASTDDSEAVIAALMEESPVPIRLVRNAQNAGSVSAQWARGVDMAVHDVVWIAEADDFADPGFLAAVLPAFADPAVVISYSESRMVDEDGTVQAPDYLGYVADIDPVRWTRAYQANGQDEIAGALAIKNTVPNVSASAFRRGVLAEVLHDNLDAMAACRNAADWLCYMRVLSRGGSIAFTPLVLNNHRRHARSVTTAGDQARHLEEIAMMQDLAAELADVRHPAREIALRYRRSVAEQFGQAGGSHP